MKKLLLVLGVAGALFTGAAAPAADSDDSLSRTITEKIVLYIPNRILDALEKAAGKYRASTQKPVLLVSMDIRRYVRRLIESKFYELPVMAYQEVTPEISVQPVARIHI